MVLLQPMTLGTRILVLWSREPDRTEANVYLFYMDNGQTATDSMFIDNAVLQAVPKPTTLALLGMGLAVPFYFIRRKS